MILPPSVESKPDVSPLALRQREILADAIAEANKSDGYVNLAAASDPATDYALGVVNGNIFAGENVRMACQRHLIDIHRRDLVWDAKAGDRFESFCKDFAVIRNPLDGTRRPFVLLDWQRFAARSIFCWKVKSNDVLARLEGTRRFRKFYLESAKGNGKTPFTSAVSLYFLMVLKENDFEGYVAGAKKDQAYIPLGDMTDFLYHMKDDNRLGGLYKAKEMAGKGKTKSFPCAVIYETQGHTSKIIYHTRTGEEKGAIEAIGISGRGTGSSGLRPVLALVTELHEVGTRTLLNLLEKGSKFRPEPLTLIDTNAGGSRIGVCWEEREKCLSMLRRDHDDDTLFALIYCVDEDDDPWKDEACWDKANPSLRSGEVIRKDYIIREMVNARTPFEIAMVERLNFGIWTESLMLPFKAKDLNRNLVEKLEVPEDARLVMALDLAVLSDMLALSWVWFRLRTGLLPEFWVRTDYWWNRVALERKPEEVRDWLSNQVEKGYINLAEGNLNDIGAPVGLIKANIKNLSGLAVDPWKLSELRLHFKNERVNWHDVMRDKRKWGVPLYRHPQGSAQERGENASPLWMSRSIQHITDALTDDLNRRIWVENNPVFVWNTGAARMKQDHLGNLYLSRPSSNPASDNIDGLMSGTMGIGLAAFLCEGLEVGTAGAVSDALLDAE